MVDVFEPAKRSLVMSRIQGKGNRSTELALADVFKRERITGWRRHVALRPWLSPGDRAAATPLSKGRISVVPDFLFRAAKLAVFVDGCFWHGCSEHCRKPDHNSEFWAKKLSGNVARDQRATRALEAAGWTVVRVWEHELKDMTQVLKRLRAQLKA
ncbi:MAG: very short patch repair endonuclease [Azonexus sp.]